MITYIPANLPGIMDHFSNIDKSLNNKLFWFLDNSIEKYNYLLISTYYGLQFEDFRKRLNIADDVIVYGDSGGFQNFSLNACMDPMQVLRWQEKNCDIGFTFDYPLAITDTKEQIKTKQKGTVDNAYIALNNRINPNLKLYAAIQGHTVDELNFIFDLYEQNKDFDKFDGFGFGGFGSVNKNFDTLFLAIVNMFERTKKYNKPMHFFGISSFKTVSLINYLSKYYKKIITFDSSTFSIGARNRIYYLEGKVPFSGITLNEKTSFKEFPCNCNVCRSFKLSEVVNEKFIGVILSYHNFNLMKNKFIMMNELINKKEEYKIWSYRNISKDLEKYYKFIDNVQEKGYENAVKNFQISFEKHSKQMTVFG
jgi:tRNA-guanine family transglycosylase